jgi:hypothetical protein
VLLKWCLNWTKADEGYCVLDVRMAGRERPLIECAPEDANGRGRGYGSIYRIYPRGTRVELQAPPVFGMKLFDHWEVIDNTDTMMPKEVREATLRIEKMDHHMQVSCWYAEGDAQRAVVRRQPAPVRELITTHLTSLRGTGERDKFLASEEFRQFQACASAVPATDDEERRHGWGSALFNEPSGFPVGPLPPEAAFTVLEGPRELEGRRWLKIDYRGTVGWVTEAGVSQ